MKPWSVMVRSLLRERPEVPEFMRGGRNVISYSALQAATDARKARRFAVEEKILNLTSDGEWWKIYELALSVDRDRAYVTRVLKEMAAKGLLDGVQNRGERREWYFRKPQKECTTL